MIVASYADDQSETVVIEPRNRVADRPLPTETDARESAALGLTEWLTRVAFVLRDGKMRMVDVDASRRRLDAHFDRLEATYAASRASGKAAAGN